MRERNAKFVSYFALYAMFTVSVTFASEEVSRPIDDHPEWLTCEAKSQCTNVKLGCWYWQPINQEFASAAGAGVVCTKSDPAGPQPTVSCVDHRCVNAPYTVREWSQLELYQKMYLVMNRVGVCGYSGLSQVTALSQQYVADLDAQIRQLRFPDSELVTTAVKSVVPCAELVAWEQGQEKWRSKQLENGSARRVVVETVKPTYPLDHLYSTLVAYALDYQQCGQRYTMPGVTFWGDMHATFTLDARGNIDPVSFKATYPGVAYEVPFLECASAAFKQLSFAPPDNQLPVTVKALIQVQSAGR